MTQVVTMLSDFGLQDSYVAEMKAMLMPLPRLRIVDITHSVPPHDIRAGAFQLLRSYRWFPRGTWHLAVVDPGVGGKRKALYVETAEYCFVGPDNGLLLWAIKDAEKRDMKPAKIFEIEVPRKAVISSTFHGRDVFAQFIAQSLGQKMQKLNRVDRMAGELFPHAIREENTYKGEVVARDHFGNIITSIPGDRLGPAFGEVGARSVKVKSVQTYEKIPAGNAALIRGSHGFWEISCRDGSAWDLLKVHVGAPVVVTFLDALPR